MSAQPKLLKALKLIGLLHSPRRYTALEICDRLKVSTATAYRYILLLKEVGFQVTSEENHYYIPGKKGAAIPVPAFEQEEAQWLTDLVSKQGEPSSSRLMSKIYLASEQYSLAGHITEAKVFQLYVTLRQAMARQRQVRLVQYYSENSDSIRDRTVEPVGFREEEKVLEAYDLDRMEIRHFRLDRMAEVEELSAPFRFQQEHRYQATDPFGVVDDQQVHVRINLSHTAKRRMEELFPVSKAFMKANGRGAILEAMVNGQYKLLDRFLMSYIDEVSILEPKSLSNHLQKKWSKKNL